MNEDAGHDLADVLHLTPHQISTGLALFYVCYVIFDLPSNLIMSSSQSTRLDEPDRHQRRSNRILSSSHESSLEFLVRLFTTHPLQIKPHPNKHKQPPPPPPGNSNSRNVARNDLLPNPILPTKSNRQKNRPILTASQVSAAIVGLVSAGFQKMDGMHGLVGFQWMFLIYGVITVALGFALLWWLPDRPTPQAKPCPHGPDV